MPTDEGNHENLPNLGLDGDSPEVPAEEVDTSTTRGFSFKKSTHGMIDAFYRENRNQYRSKSHVVEVAVLEFLKSRGAYDGQGQKDIHAR